MHIILINDGKTSHKYINQNQKIEELDTDDNYYSYHGKLLDNNLTINDYNITNNSIIFANKRLPGGAIPGFPDTGILIILFALSTVLLVCLFYFFYIMVDTIVFKKLKDCPPLDYFKVIQQAKNAWKGKGGSLFNNITSIFHNNTTASSYFYYLSAILYCSFIVFTSTIYLYIFFCSKTTISIFPLFFAGLSFGSIVLFFMLFYELTSRFEIIKDYSKFIISSIFSFSCIIFFILFFISGVSKITFLYPIGIILMVPIIYFVSQQNWTKIIKFFIYIISFISLSFIPYVISYVYNVFYLC